MAKLCLLLLPLLLALPGLSRADARYGSPAADLEQVFALLDQRLAHMPEVAAAKWSAKLPVFDATREEALLAETSQRALGLGIEAGSARALLTLQMQLAREVQQRLFTDWEAGRAPVPAARDLKSALRPELDRLGEALLRALTLALPELSRSDFAAQQRERAAKLLATHQLPPQHIVPLLTALGALRALPDARLTRIRASGVLRIGTTGDYAPFSSDAGGSLTGLDIALLSEFAKALGVEPRFVRTSWPSLLEDYARDTFDLAASGISITPERAAHGRFSPPYHSGGKTPIARCDARARLDSLAKIDLPSVRVIVNPGGSNEQFARTTLKQAQLQVFPDNRTIFEELIAGRADVMLTDDVEAELQQHRHKAVLCRTMRSLLTHADKAWLVQPDRALLAEVERWLGPRVKRGSVSSALRRLLTSAP
jgi:cyclohexadienyl dehydratase